MIRRTPLIQQILLLFIFAFVAACSDTTKVDNGGKVDDYLAYVDSADAHHEQIRIEGWCISACTVKLGAKDVCIYPSATLYFHQASDPITGARSDLATAMMFEEYPPKIQEWVTEHKALDHEYLISLSGADAIKRGISECK